MVKKKTGLRDAGFDEQDKYDELEDADDPYISKREPDQFEVKNRPNVKYSDYWSSIDKTAEFFKNSGYTLNSINYDRMTSGQLKYGANTQAERFFQRVDLSKAPIDVTIPVMHRRKAFEFYKDKGIEKRIVKEWLTYHLRLEGIDWLGARLTCSIENEGIGHDVREQLHVTVDDNGQQHGEFRFVGVRNKFYIPFNKKAVDSVIAKYGVDKSGILFYGIIPESNTSLAGGFKYNGYTYEQFTGLDWEGFTDVARRWMNKQLMDKQNNPPSLAQKGIA